jgi:hypothetical protein
VKAGSDFVLQFHYTTNGTPATDRSKIGLVFAKSAPKKRALIVPVSDTSFMIPPGAASYRSTATRTLATDAVLISAGPHMHLRGKAMEVFVTDSTGRRNLVLEVPAYDFNWQLLYEFGPPITLTRGMRLEATGMWDNSAANAKNPDPTAQVRWGDQSWEEMLIAWVTMQIDPSVDVDAVFEKTPSRIASDDSSKK